MRVYGVPHTTSVDRVDRTVLISIAFSDEDTAAKMAQVLRTRQQHDALVIDLSRPTPVIDGECVRL